MSYIGGKPVLVERRTYDSKKSETERPLGADMDWGALATSTLSQYGPAIAKAAEKYGPQLQKYAVKYGPKIMDAAKKYGPKALELASLYGPQALAAMKKTGSVAAAEQQLQSSGAPKAPQEPWYKAAWVLPVGIGVAALGALTLLKKKKAA